ncbi:MAG TPA: glycosyltransferase [Patescibacteria group bacterium]|nr:glycosyltransferase [Patescibacteria group bacterium]
MDKIVIVMPAFNEAENIGPMVEALCGTEFPKIKDADMHLLVVDANSPDGTGKIVSDKQGKYKNLHLLSKDKGGLGADYVAGFKYAVDKLSADAVMEMDADFQHPPRFVKPMVDAYLEGAEYVIGSRYIPGGSVPKEWALFRKAVSYFGNLYIRLVLLKPSIHDLTTGFRLTKVKGVLDKIDIDHLMEQKRFAYKVDLLYQSIKNAKKVKEVPLEFAPRTKEQSKFNMKETVSTLKVATILGIKDKARFIKFGTVGFIGYVVNAVGLAVFAKLGFPEWGIWAAATEVAIVSNFILNNLWTFKSEKITGVGFLLKKFFQFNLTSTGALIIQAIFGSLGVAFFGTGSRQLLLPFIILLLVLPYNYFMYNAVIWKTWKMPWSRK